jgi:hypothetical protein
MHNLLEGCGSMLPQFDPLDQTRLKSYGFEYGFIQAFNTAGW